MKLEVSPGKYIVAVSGGVDSVVLLDLLAAMHGLDIVVAHFDHGIRAESAEDALFVVALAKKYGLPFFTERAELGANASENAARTARYDFLRRLQKQQRAQAIITAHHQDDVLETAIFNMLRGTGRRGLSSLKSQPGLLRPLLHISKKDLTNYALKHKLSWREDTTNYDERYARNYIRHRLLVHFDDQARQQLLAIITASVERNDQLDAQLTQLLQKYQISNQLDRQWFTQLPHSVAKEVMASWLRQASITDFDRLTIERLVVQCKTKPVGKRLDVRGANRIAVRTQTLALETAER